MNPIGRARVEQEVIDKSVLNLAGLQGITAVLGKTERGKVGESKLIGSFKEYQRYFGDLLDSDDFPLICKRAFERGAKLRIARVGGSGGAKATSGDWSASSEGLWGNNVEIKIVPSISGDSNEVDIKAAIIKSGKETINFIVTRVNKTLTDADLLKLKTLEIVDYTGNSGDTLSTGTINLSGGTDFTTATTDYTNGLTVFDEKSDFVKIAVPAMAIPEIDAVLVAYASYRKDCRAMLRTPIGISGNVAVDYRLRQGSYSGQVPDTYFADMYFGGIKIKHPYTNEDITITALGDVLGIFSSKDTAGKQWYSGAGSKRGRIAAIGVDYNLATPARTMEFDYVDVNGINAVVDDPDFGVVLWGNSTLQKENTLLKHSNVADLIVYLNRVISPYAKSELFDPNDVTTWNAIFRKVNPVMRALKSRRAFWDYKYDGDQFVNSIDEATVNDPNDVDAGKYVFYLYIKPKVGLKYVGIKVVVTNSGVSFEEVKN